ncbi:hypothetical protein BZB76_0562 [Actinomadura pelletieri DSM 43383]|uniref:Carbohydrate-binding protein n=1 Tax=Actinomadura pelletieri DSM 43383 TaxID=1120940 RepID=A0A495QYB8_9ACTN|nr:carbohydrate-binding protein [Actinomadura pelletieri]RKS79120.1 hypothetical protein BZB76_0562 [Actinomadura pelletieri DSM 43383]
MKRRSMFACAVLIATTFTSAGAAAAATGSGPGTAASPDPNAPKGGVVAGAHAFAPGARNSLAAKRFRELHRARLQRDEIHEFWGVQPAGDTHDGIMATQSVAPNYRVSSYEDFTYAPTLKAAGSCMEVTTVYSLTMGNGLWAWDWCGHEGPARELKIDDEFIETYTKPVNDRPAYNIQLVQTNAATNEWTAYLYNHKTAVWDLFYRQSGRDQSNATYGWDIFEIYATNDPSSGNAYFCSEAKNDVFESSSIRLRLKEVWRPASPVDSPWEPTAQPNPKDWGCPALKFDRAGANDHWAVHQ